MKLNFKLFTSSHFVDSQIWNVLPSLLLLLNVCCVLCRCQRKSSFPLPHTNFTITTKQQRWERENTSVVTWSWSGMWSWKESWIILEISHHLAMTCGIYLFGCFKTNRFYDNKNKPSPLLFSTSRKKVQKFHIFEWMMITFYW